MYEYYKEYQEYKYGEKLIIKYASWLSKHEDTYEYRKGNVPGIKKYKASGNNCHRYPKTKQELTYFYIADEDDRELLTKAQISAIEKYNSTLPTAWDDKPREYINKSWKHYRNKQYKK